MGIFAISVDYGDPVTKGELIAVIESPELDRQYDAALADAANKEKEAKRSRGLVPKGGVSEELAEQREADARIAWATVASLVIAESDGKTMKLQSGVEEKEKVILNGGGGIIDREIVSPMETN